MVLPGDELTVKLRHIGMRDGNIVVNIETSNARGEKVIQGSAEVSQSTWSTVYVFTGQGSEEPVHSTTVPKTLPGVTRTEVGDSVTFKFGSKLPETESTGRLVPDFGWLRAQLALCPGFFSYRCQDTSYWVAMG